MAVNNHLADNTVKYRLFPIVNCKEDCTVEELLEVIAENYISKLSSELSPYIWHAEAFNLQPSVGEKGLVPHLKGMTCFEDNIEDEWFIVYLLHQLTKEDKNLIVKIEDNDGEFLLIEAAECIPRWLNPDTSENRVYLYNESLHIIPKVGKKEQTQFTEIPRSPTISDALSIIRHHPHVTKASQGVQDAIQSRISGYPQKITEYHHRAHCYVPAAVAAILKEEPRLLSEAVRAFCLRTPLDIKACKAMKYFPPETRVMTEVVFTRCMYSQLLSQNYEPDKRTGWNMPQANDPLYKAHDLGMKLACGFEIIVSNDSNRSDADVEIPSDANFNDDSKWKRFLKSLNDINYFKGEIEGSKLYFKQLQQAKEFYLHSLKKDTDTYSSPCNRIKYLLGCLSVNYEEMKDSEKTLAEPDDDSWMNLTLNNLDALLAAKFACKGGESETKVPEAITHSLKAFMEHPSGIEGAEFPSNVLKQQNINFDPETFSEAMKNILDFTLPEMDCGSSSSMSSYSDEEMEQKVGKSEPVQSNTSDATKEMKEYMDQMDRELASTAVGMSFERLPPSVYASNSTTSTVSDKPVDINDELDEFRPVDVDLTALKNILESYSNQHGLPGPASNLLASMGVQLPDDSDI